MLQPGIRGFAYRIFIFKNIKADYFYFRGKFSSEIISLLFEIFICFADNSELQLA